MDARQEAPITGCDFLAVPLNFFAAAFEEIDLPLRELGGLSEANA
jgi:hypothetical protein